MLILKRIKYRKHLKVYTKTVNDLIEGFEMAINFMIDDHAMINNRIDSDLWLQHYMLILSALCDEYIKSPLNSPVGILQIRNTVEKMSDSSKVLEIKTKMLDIKSELNDVVRKKEILEDNLSSEKNMSCDDECDDDYDDDDYEDDDVEDARHELCDLHLLEKELSDKYKKCCDEIYAIRSDLIETLFIAIQVLSADHVMDITNGDIIKEKFSNKNKTKKRKKEE